MIIWRTQNHAAHSALRHESVFALGWLGGGALGLIEGVEMFPQDVLDRLRMGDTITKAEVTRKRDHPYAVKKLGDEDKK